MVDAATSAKKILKGRCISHVVVVDDQVAPPTWYGLVDLLDSETRAEIGHETEFDLLSEDWRERLEVASRETRELVATKVNEAADRMRIARPEREAEDPSLAALQQLLRSFQPLQLTPNQWQERADELLERAVAEPTLFLIDQRLEAGREGGSLVKSLLDDNSEGCFFCILTADTSIEDEFEYWQKLCEEHGFEPGRVGFVAKDHLTRDDQIGFARMLKISLTAREVQDVQARVLKAARKALSKAVERFGEIDLQTLTSIVFESSHAEGTWEVDTILRVVRAFVDESLDTRVYGDQEIADAVKEIAAAASVETGVDERLRESAFSIQRSERYVTSNYLATRRVALANGDLFKVIDANNVTSLWVLVAQPCDLAIRSNGKRNGSPTHLTVLPVEQRPNEPKRGTYVELLHYLPPGSDRAFVHMTAPAYVPTSILDLAAFSATGEAVWVRGTEADAMRVVGWQKRAKKISDQFEAAVRDHDDLTGLDNEGRRRIELGLPVAEMPEIRPAVGEDQVRYPIRRVGRLRERQAETVLQAFGLALSRTAEVHDLARISP